MSELVTFSDSDTRHNTSQAERMRKELQREFEEMDISVSTEIQRSRVGIRFMLSPVQKGNTHKDRLPVIEVPTGVPLDLDTVLKGVRKELQRYRQQH